MENLIYDFFVAWEKEIVAYQEVLLCLKDQKESLINWDIEKFQKISQQTAILTTRSHRATSHRNDLLETIFLLNDFDTTQNNLKTVSNVFEQDDLKDKAEVFYTSFINTLKSIDQLSNDNKDLIQTGLDLVGKNLELISDIVDNARVYSRVGMIPQKRNAIILNTQA